MFLSGSTATIKPFHEPLARGVKGPNMSTINVAPNPVTHVARCGMDGDGDGGDGVCFVKKLGEPGGFFGEPIPPRYFFQDFEVGCYRVTHLKKN